MVVSGPGGVGKTMFGDVLLGLRAPDARLVQRAAGLSRHAFQKIYQDPVASFAPDQKLRAAMTETARLHGRRDADWLEVLVRPALLFGDEPMSRLAPGSQQAMIGLMREACQGSNCAVLPVTHDPALAASAADRVVTVPGR